MERAAKPRATLKERVVAGLSNLFDLLARHPFDAPDVHWPLDLYDGARGDPPRDDESEPPGPRSQLPWPVKPMPPPSQRWQSPETREPQPVGARDRAVD